MRIHRSLQAFVFRPSEVTTAWEVLERLKALAADDPRRINMRGYIWQKKDFHPDTPYGFDWPECGTVGCLSGWTSVLLRHEKHDPDRIVETIGPAVQEDRTLFFPPWYQRGGQRNADSIPEIIQHIEQFQAAHERALKAKRIVVESE